MKDLLSFSFPDTVLDNRKCLSYPLFNIRSYLFIGSFTTATVPGFSLRVLQPRLQKLPVLGNPGNLLFSCGNCGRCLYSTNYACHIHVFRRCKMSSSFPDGSRDSEGTQCDCTQVARRGTIDKGVPTLESSSVNSVQRRILPPHRIVMIIEPSPFTHVSGYSNRFIETLRYLKEAGDDVLIVVPEVSGSAPKEIFGFPIVNIPGFRFALYPNIVLSTGAYVDFFSVLYRFKPDIVHLATPGCLCFSVLNWARFLRVPLLLSYHTHLPMYAKKYGLGYLEGLCWRLIRYVSTRADLTLTVSTQVCKEMEEKGVKNVQIWRKAVDCNRFHPKFRSLSKRQLLTNNNPSNPLVIYVGRLGIEKNLLCLKELFKYIPNLSLAFIGNGPFAMQLESHYRDTATIFTGILSGQELSEAFASADVFVMPSETETLGFVVLEAMASGVPVVATRSGGIPDLVQHEITGLLYEPGDMATCALYVSRLIEDPYFARKLSAKARKEAENWDWRTATAVLRNTHYHRAMHHFQNTRAMGISLPRTLSIYRWFRRKYIIWKQQFSRYWQLLGFNL
ncbi:Sulfoquinovosyl transferase SQD2 [Galdieria sulphuraria]|uniref:Sulfoquinovosyltransferase n=1 Tax=Galdieria sulphuraria TaxID=130081 RepID=M2W3C7_GALSU|nr:sulfoquinovosyltransferase [Galdieria sulphuraria]EME30201.1 sulfoquinovosyltransferase [Galdieria sulphuraria]GJD08367.1 Sulfoquinovosyl transferase SQD2 [Galdieria sulphuraria]|eukprot:XP_005706721.1 sulfoquinovosyltransferase [Galdieria sulphuraria]